MRGPLQSDGPARGMIEDFDTIKATVGRTVLDALDHTTLNDVIENPTCERIVMWIWERLLPEMPMLDELVLWETRNSCATLKRSDFKP